MFSKHHRMKLSLSGALLAASACLLAPVGAAAFCDGMGTEVGSSFGCEDASVGIFGPEDGRRSFARDDGSVGFVQGSDGSLFVSDAGGFGASYLPQGTGWFVVTDDGRWGTVTRQGAAAYQNLDPAWAEEDWNGDPDF